MNHSHSSAALIAGILLTASVASSQAPVVPSRQSGSALPFNFDPPGARAMAMGGAFVGIADDATAAEANPAGLTILTKPEISAHYRYSSYQLPYEDPNMGRFAEFDDSFEEFTPHLEKNLSSVPFFSFVYPFKRSALSIYYQEIGRFQGSNGVETYDPETDKGLVSTHGVDYSLRSSGVSYAFRISDMVSIGASIRDSHLAVTWLASARGQNLIDYGETTDPSEVTDISSLVNTVDDLDTDITFNVGVLINANGVFSVGLVYKNGGSYSLNSSTIEAYCVNSTDLDLECIEGGDGTFSGSGAFVSSASSTITLRIPDFWGLGLAWRPTEGLTVAFDADYITYSKLETTGDTSTIIDDAVEFHVGMEYTMLPGDGQKPVSLRAGLYNDPDHDGYSTIDSDQIHYTVGAGMAFGTVLQVDLAVHFADTVDEFLLSAVYRF